MYQGGMFSACTLKPKKSTNYLAVTISDFTITSPANISHGTDVVFMLVVHVEITW